ncbi:MAG: hypothetical protein ABSB22_14515 [Thermodesulfobacteriota bacterium]
MAGATFGHGGMRHPVARILLHMGLSQRTPLKAPLRPWGSITYQMI